MAARATRQTGASRAFCGERNRRLYTFSMRGKLTVVGLRTLRNDELAAVKIRNSRDAGSLL
jgi:hypothetical protein